MDQGTTLTDGGQANTLTPATGAGESWFGGFPDELKGNELITKFDSAESLAKEHLSLNKQLTDLKTSLPQPPQSPDEYKFEIPEGTELDQAAADKFKKFAFENKIPVELANKLVGFELQIQRQAQERAVAEFNKKLEQGQMDTETALKKKWGADFDANIKLAQRVAQKFLPENIRKYLNDSGFGNNPELVEGFYNIAKVLSEDVFSTGKEPAAGPRTDEFGRPTLDFPSMRK